MGTALQNSDKIVISLVEGVKGNFPSQIYKSISAMCHHHLEEFSSTL